MNTPKTKKTAVDDRHTPSTPSPEGGRKPRLFYYEEAVDAWLPVPTQSEDFVNTDMLCDTEDEIEIRFKRFDLTDEELANLPES